MTVIRRCRPLMMGVVAVAITSCAPPELCGDGIAPSITRTTYSPTNGFLHAAHAHNDYEHARPLRDALDHGFGSVEADVWFRDGGIQVSHDAFSTAGTLDALYLDPLADILAEQRSVHGEGAGFVLWLDLKEGSVELTEALVAALAARPFLTRYDDAGVIEQGQVDVILTGDAGGKTAMVEETAAPRPFTRDDNGLAIDDEFDGTVTAAALNFGGYVGGWDGVGEVPEGLSRQCGCVVEKAHSLGRKVRLFGGPDTEASWRFQLDHGTDFVNADDLAGLQAVLEAR